MSSHICASCGSPFPRNDVLATLADGQRFAFDPARARVWRVCSACGQWNLLGAEASAGALPELQQRFATGLIQEFDGLALSGLAGTMQLIRLGAADTPAPTDAGALRDDVARQARRKEVDGRTSSLMWLFWLLLGSWMLISVLNLGVLLVEEGRRGALFAAGAVGAWLVTLGVTSILWRRHQPTSSSLFTPWRQPTRKAQLVNGGAVAYLLYTFTQAANRIHGHGLEVSQLGGLLVLLGLLLPILISVPGKGRTSWSPKAMRLLTGLSFVILAAVIILLSWGKPRWFPTMMIGMMGLIVTPALVRVRRGRFTVPLASGETLSIRHTALKRMVFHWSDETHAFEITGLPDGTRLVGDDAAELVSRVLQWYHHHLPQLPDTTEQAWQLLRSVGDLRGLLAMLAGYRADHDGRIDLLNLPAVYRLALDFALADRQRVTTGIAPLRDASEAAIEVAEEAEELDRELRLPAPP